MKYKKIYFSTGVNVLPEMFDFELGKIKGAMKKVKDDNLIIERCLASLRRKSVKKTEEVGVKKNSLFDDQRVEFGPDSYREAKRIRF
jgi:hypothetical protein